MTGELLRKGSLLYDAPCPDCEGPKHKTAMRCRACAIAAKSNGGFKKAGDGLHTTSRHESIITFTRGAERQSRQCIGEGRPAQIADGLRQLGEDWEPACISTPSSILRDLKQQAE